MENNKNVVGIVIVVLTIIILGLVGFIVYREIVVKDNNSGVIENNNQNNVVANLEYRLDKNESTGFTKIYVNNKLVDKEFGTDTITKTNKINDILLIETCTSDCEIYVINKNAEIIGTNVTNSTIPQIFKTGFSIDKINKIEGNSIYIESSILFHNKSILCNYNNEDVIMKVERYDYLGNETFGQPTIVQENKLEDYLKVFEINSKNLIGNIEKNEILSGLDIKTEGSDQPQSLVKNSKIYCNTKSECDKLLLSLEINHDIPSKIDLDYDNKITNGSIEFDDVIITITNGTASYDKNATCN